MQLTIKRRYAETVSPFINGSSKGRLSLHCSTTGKRVTQSAKLEDVSILTALKWQANAIEA